MIEQLQREIALIHDFPIKHLVEETLKKAPEYFWTIPASSTGKHHPKDDLAVGGTVIHTKKAVKIGEELCQAFNVAGFKRDVVIAALILHDICKSGYPINSGNTVSGHAYLVMQIMYEAGVRFIDDHTKVDTLMPNTSVAREIASAISTHMGRWDIPFESPHDAIGLIVHMADYFVSRKCVSIDLEAEE